MNKDIIKELVFKHVSNHTDVVIDDILSRSRESRIGVVLARFLCYELLYTHLGFKLKETAAALNRTSHGTVIAALERVRDDEEYFKQFNQLVITILNDINYEILKTTAKVD